MKRTQLILFVLLVASGVALVTAALWLWAPLWLLVILLVAGCVNLLGLAAALLSGSYAQRSNWREAAHDVTGAAATVATERHLGRFSGG